MSEKIVYSKPVIRRVANAEKVSEDTRDVTHLTNVQFARRAHVHPGTTANWRVAGFGPKWVKYGRQILYPLKEVERWEEKSLKQNTNQECSQ